MKRFRYIVQEQLGYRSFSWADLKSCSTLKEARAFACDASGTTRIVKLESDGDETDWP